MLESDALYQLWAPPESPWSPWVKPVLLAHLGPADEPSIALRSVDVPWAPPADGRTAIVCDLRGASGVQTGVALAERGYRPVLLYNALPAPAPTPQAAVVNVRLIITALEFLSPTLAALTLPHSAPPVFLLDADRRAGSPAQGQFDNRSLSFPTDFPSANLLRLAGISQIVLVQDLTRTPQDDLVPTLFEWQQAGLAISAVATMLDPSPQPLAVRKPTWWGRLWLRIFAALGLRGNATSGFGAFVPQSG